MIVQGLKVISPLPDCMYPFFSRLANIKSLPRVNMQSESSASYGLVYSGSLTHNLIDALCCNIAFASNLFYGLARFDSAHYPQITLVQSR